MNAALRHHCDLAQILASREARAQRQAALRARRALPQVSLTLVSPGPVKDGLLQQNLMRAALAALDARLSVEGWPVLERELLWQSTGPEALYAVNAPAQELKAALVELENRHPLGRLWDLDVIDANGPLSRRALGMPQRACLLCADSAHACARAQRHPLDQLLAVIEERYDEFAGLRVTEPSA